MGVEKTKGRPVGLEGPRDLPLKKCGLHPWSNGKHGESGSREEHQMYVVGRCRKENGWVGGAQTESRGGDVVQA